MNRILIGQYLFHPTDFDGITLSSYQSHFMRGHDDKVSLWLGLFLTVKRTSLELFKRILSINQFEKKNGYYTIKKIN